MATSEETSQPAVSDLVDAAPAGRARGAAAVAPRQPRLLRQDASEKASRARAERAAQRQARSLLRRPVAASPRVFGAGSMLPLTLPEEISVSQQQLETYALEAKECFEWIRLSPEWSTINLKDPELLDQAVTAYLALLFDLGEPKSVASSTIFGVIFDQGLPKLKSSLPRARRALAGFAKDEPDISRDPAPEEVLALMVEDLLRKDSTTAQGDLLALCAAACSVVQFDLTSRPTETLQLTREKIILPQGRRHPRPCVVFHPQNLAKSTTVTNRVSKSGEMDDTVMSSMDGSLNHIYTTILMTLRTAGRPGEPLFAPLSLNSYEKVIRQSASRLELDRLEISPHTWRHGSAAKALNSKILSEKQLATRMRVLRLETTRRYAKTGKLQRQLQLLGAPRRRRAEALMLGTDRTSNPFHELAHRLSHLRLLRRRAGH